MNTLPLLRAVEHLVPAMQARAAALDMDASFPASDFRDLRAAGMLGAPVPVRLGGAGIGTAAETAHATLALLQLLGRGSLAVGRLFEAHVNALRLVFRYGDAALVQRAAADAHAGHLCGLWVTDAPGGSLQAGNNSVIGSKQFCSGAGHVTRAVVTFDQAGGTRLAFVAIDDSAHIRPLPGGLAGMRAAKTGQVTFTDTPAMAFGEPGDYLREPDFSGGAWRTSAVTLGGLEALIDQFRTQLRERGRDSDPHQQARFGHALIAAETARLWLQAMAERAEHGDTDPPAAVAYVNLARMAVERCCLDTMELVQRSLGVAAFMRGNPVERLCRDLATYLRQPAGDMVLTEAAAAYLAGSAT